MKQFENERPPRWALAFFRWFCHPELREYIEGDLLELYHQRRTGLGLTKAKWLLIKDVLMLFRPAIIGNPNTRLQQFSIMKNIKWTRLVLINLLVGLMILSPFSPGPSNKLVLVLSTSAQTIGYLGLALIPLGLAWAFIQAYTYQKSHDRIAISVSLLIAFIFLSLAIALPHTMPKVSFFVALLFVLTGLMASWRHGALVILAVTSTACLSFVLLVLTLAVFVGVGVLPGFLLLLSVIGAITWLVRQIMAMKKSDNATFRQLPFYMVSVPAVALLVSVTLMRPASNFSRAYAIERSQALIAAIENHKIKKGSYPETLDELSKPMNQPFIMGVDKFRYNKMQDQYTLAFSQWLDWGSLEEIVLYTRGDMGETTADKRNYDYRIDAWRVKGAFASYDTKHPDWRYYHCD